MDNVIYIAGKPYTRDDAFAKSDPDEYIYEEEMSAYLDMYGYDPDDDWRDDYSRLHHGYDWSNEL